MATEDQPRSKLAGKTLAAPLRAALKHLFGQEISGCMLVGGTALAGYYAAHRRSDDIDLFTDGPLSQEAAVLAVESLTTRGALLEGRQRSAQFYRTVCRWRRGVFTIDVAQHPGLFKPGASVRLSDGVVVATLKTLLAMKTAALLSRCSEKDLYDLLWLLGHHKELTLRAVIEIGASVDAGVTPEGLLIALTGSDPALESCGFSKELGVTNAKIHKQITALRRMLLKEIAMLAENQPPPPIGDFLQRIRRLTLSA